MTFWHRCAGRGLNPRPERSTPAKYPPCRHSGIFIPPARDSGIVNSRWRNENVRNLFTHTAAERRREQKNLHAARFSCIIRPRADLVLPPDFSCG